MAKRVKQGRRRGFTRLSSKRQVTIPVHALEDTGLGPGDELKVVVCDEADFRWAVEVIDRLGLWGRVPVLFSPSFGEVAPQDLARWVLASERPARLQLQMHKIIWGAEARGV